MFYLSIAEKFQENIGKSFDGKEIRKTFAASRLEIEFWFHDKKLKILPLKKFVKPIGWKLRWKYLRLTEKKVGIRVLKNSSNRIGFYAHSLREIKYFLPNPWSFSSVSFRGNDPPRVPRQQRLCRNGLLPQNIVGLGSRFLRIKVIFAFGEIGYSKTIIAGEMARRSHWGCLGQMRQVLA